MSALLCAVIVFVAALISEPAISSVINAATGNFVFEIKNVAVYLRDHAGEAVAVADIMPAAVGDRTLNSVEYRRVEIVVYEALKKIAKRGTVRQDGQGAKRARFNPCLSG